MENSILKIQVEKKNKELRRMQSHLNSTQEDLIKLKNRLQEMEKKRLREEVLSDNNVNYVKHYKDIAKMKDKEIFRLKKRLKTYVLQEKRVLVKEKAFELERAENFRNVVNLRNELNKEKLKNEKIVNRQEEFY